MRRLDGYRMRMVLVGVVAAIVFGRVELANGATITVGPGAGYDFGTIQAGIDAANDADTVLVAPGEYVIAEPITFRGKAITVQSEAGRDETTIRMSTPADTNRASVVIFENNETTESVLDGFTITGGTGSPIWVPYESKFAWVGGGILFDASSGTVKNCAIVQNSVEAGGGGVFCAYPCLPILIDCIIAENSQNSASGSGGGVFPWYGASLTVTNCTIAGNSAEFGAGVFCGPDSSMTMTGCTIAENSAVEGGGGMFAWSGSSLTLTNCRIAENSATLDAGGVGCVENSSVAMTHCVVIGNMARRSGGGLGCYRGASATVTNSILWGNTATAGNEIYLEQAPTEFSVTYSNVAGGQAEVRVDGGTLNWGEGNIDADPYFADSANGDYHLRSEAGRWDPIAQYWVQDEVTSPCIDAGDPMSPIGWESFPNGGFVNMGAYGGTSKASRSYFGEPVCETIVAGDINGDGQVNRADLEIMALHWTDDVPLPAP